MEIGEIFKDVIKYPIQDWKKLITVSGISLITSILVVIGMIPLLLGLKPLSGLTIDIWIGIVVATIFTILAVIVSLILGGYQLDIARQTIKKNSEIPELNIKENIIDGLKIYILQIIYSIIPTIIIIIVAIFTLGGGIMNIFMSPSASQVLSSNSTETIIPILTSSFLVPLIITSLIALVLGVIYFLAVSVATPKLAETNSIVSALNIFKNIDIISAVGWTKYILWLIVLGILYIGVFAITNGISTILRFMGTLFMFIPIVGPVIFIIILLISLIISALASGYLILLTPRAMGLIYNDSK